MLMPSPESSKSETVELGEEFDFLREWIAECAVIPNVTFVDTIYAPIGCKMIALGNFNLDAIRADPSLLETETTRTSTQLQTIMTRIAMRIRVDPPWVACVDKIESLRMGMTGPYALDDPVRFTVIFASAADQPCGKGGTKAC